MRVKNYAAMATSLDQKVECLLKAMDGISSRLDKIDLKFDKLENRINYLEHIKLSNVMKSIKFVSDTKYLGVYLTMCQR